MADDFLSPEDREQWNALLDASLNGSRRVDERAVDRAEVQLAGAEDAQRPWARVVTRRFIRSGLRKLLSERAKAEAVVLMDYNGKPVETTMRVGVRRRTDEGKRESTLPLLSEISWPQLDEWLTMIETQLSAALVNRTKARRLLALREQFPDTAGPADACQRLGCTVEEFLERAAS